VATVHLGEDDQQRRQRLGAFLDRLAPVAAIFGLLEAWAGTRYNDRAALASALVILLFSGTALVAARQNAHGRTELASGLTAAALTSGAVALVVVQPELHAALAIVPLMGVVVAYPYLEGRALATFLLASVTATSTIALLGTSLPPTTRLPRLFDLLFQSAATTAMVGFVAFFLWQHRARTEARLVDEETRRERLEVAIAELTGREREARILAMRDPVTGLANRRLFLDRLEETVAAIERGEKQAAVLFLDLDRFKEINDRYGHAAGDLLLSRVATTLQRSVRASETLARFGGDEFALVMPRIEIPSDAENVAKRLLSRLAEPIEGPWGALEVAASVGLALAPDHASTSAGLLRAADRAMYRAKAAGGRQFAWGRPTGQSSAQISSVQLARERERESAS
jgi:diguanylate cyclase (GGDEF)-like protein